MEKEKQSPGNESGPKKCCKCCKRPLCQDVTVRLCEISVLFSVIATLAGIVLLGFGALYINDEKWFFLAGGVCLAIALPVLGIVICYVIYRNASIRSKADRTSVSSEEHFEKPKQSDYPMGPLVVLTLPTTQSPQPAEGKSPRDCSSTLSTPDILGRNQKNTPPLASAETLTPSLLSSRGSVNSNL